MRATTPFLLLVLFFCVISGCTTGSGLQRSSPALQTEVRERSAELVAAEAAKDFEKAISFWLPDAVVHLEGVAAIRGLSAIRQTYAEFFKTVRSFRGETESVTVASSGDLAFETGTNYMTVESPSGVLAPAASKYLAVWKRGGDGRWRVAAIAITSNPAK